MVVSNRCHIQNPFIFEKTWYPVVFFVYAPIFSAIFFTTAMMARVYNKVRQQSKRASRWELSRVLHLRRRETSTTQPQQRRHRLSIVTAITSRSRNAGDESRGSFGNGSRNLPGRQAATSATSTLERQVFIQSVLYLSAFYLSWTFLLAATIEASPMTAKANELNIYGFYLTCFILAPLQGAWNCVIYFRPRILSRWSSKGPKPTQSRLCSNEGRSANESQHPRASKLLFWHQASTRHGSNNHQEETSDVEGPTHSVIDPSVYIAGASMTEISGTAETAGGRSASPGEVQLAPIEDSRPSFAPDIREELAQLEGAEGRIEDYTTDEGSSHK
jgi:hypothetical protein